MGSVDNSYSPGVGSEELSFLFHVRLWERQFKAHCQHVRGDLAAPLHCLVLLLLGLWRQVMCIKLIATLSRDNHIILWTYQKRHDCLWMYCQRANEMASQLLLQCKDDVSNPPFCVNTAVIIPLFFCGFYCRDWAIRRETLALLGAWEDRFHPSSKGSVRGALQSLIDIESERLRPGDMVPQSARIHFARVMALPGSSRLHFSYLV